VVIFSLAICYHPEGYIESSSELWMENGLVETSLRDARAFSSDMDVLGAASLIRRCLKLDPESRPSAEDLMKDPWFSDII